MDYSQFPPPSESGRLRDYETYNLLFEGDHLLALQRFFPRLAKDYDDISYMAINLARSSSKLAADLLFGEFPTIRLEGGDNEWLRAFMVHNRFRTQMYESAMEGSSRGDIVFRLRSQDGQLIFEDLNPACYFPEYEPGNVRAQPKRRNLIFEKVVSYNGEPRKAYLVESHTPGLIENSLYLVDQSGKKEIELDVKTHLGIEARIDTGIQEPLVYHIKNFGSNNSHFGVSDYKDLIPVFHGINNRMSRNDNILDKHGDPILLLPPSVYQKLEKQKGQEYMRRKQFDVLSFDDKGGQEPKYVSWDSKLEVSTDHINRLMEFFHIISETNASIYGMDKDGAAESGRALKFRLLRSLARKQRTQNYYEDDMSMMLYAAQKFALANDLKCGDTSLKGQPVLPSIKFADGIINDAMEIVEAEITKLDGGLTTQKEAVAAVDNSSMEEAEAKVKAIKEEKQANIPTFAANPIGNQDQNTNSGE